MEHFDVICDYNVKHNLKAARFKTSILTYCDSTNKGKICMEATSNCELHRVHVDITMANMHCNDPYCAHGKPLYISDDNSGFFHL